MRMGSGGKVLFQFQMDSECHELYEQIRQFRSHHRGIHVGGSETLNELLTSVFKDYLKRNHPAHRDQSLSEIKVQETLFNKEKASRTSQKVAQKVKLEKTVVQLPRVDSNTQCNT